MKSIRLIPVVCVLFSGLLAFAHARAAAEEEQSGAVFVMTNAATGNQVKAYVREENGSLQAAGEFATGGNGSGGAVDPLHSQGSLILSDDHHWLFAVNAASGTVSSFAVDGAHLTLADTQATHGSLPTALAQSGDLLYVLNAGGNGNVSGFRVYGGHLHSIPNSTANLSGDATSPTSLAFSPNGRFLVVTETATNKVDVFRVRPNGTLSGIVANPSAGATPFAAVFAPNGTLIVGNASNSISSYRLDWDQSVDIISDALPTFGQATCWDVVARGHLVYTANAGTSNLSGFAIGRDGSLTAIDGTVVGVNPGGSTNIDIAAGANGRFIYTLNTGAGAIGIFSVDAEGSLQRIGEVDGLPASGGLNGIAAY
ncbi:MAG TPA: beta-propeller fold lactonase family protein [Terracidiphilus sp.]